MFAQKFSDLLFDRDDLAVHLLHLLLAAPPPVRPVQRLRKDHGEEDQPVFNEIDLLGGRQLTC